MGDEQHLSAKTLAAMDWCETFAIAVSAFSDGKIHAADVRQQALKVWLAARHEDPIQIAKREWRSGAFTALEQPSDVSQQETLPSPLVP